MLHHWWTQKGFEPSTPWLPVRCSTKLSYWPKKWFFPFVLLARFFVYTPQGWLLNKVGNYLLNQSLQLFTWPLLGLNQRPRNYEFLALPTELRGQLFIETYARLTLDLHLSRRVTSIFACVVSAASNTYLRHRTYLCSDYTISRLCIDGNFILGSTHCRQMLCIHQWAVYPTVYELLTRMDLNHWPPHHPCGTLTIWATCHTSLVI